MGSSAEGKKQAMKEEDKKINEVISQIKHKYVVMSGKGGVGKSTVAVNLAVTLSERGYRVGLMDVDFHGPNTLKMLGLEGEKFRSEDGFILPVKYNDNLKVVSISSMLENSDSAVIWRGPLKTKAVKQFITDISWGDCDYLIIDSPPGTGDEPLSVAQIIKESKAIIVTTPQEVSILDIRKSVTFCNQVSMPVLGIIENMSSLICPYCHQKIDLFSSGGGEKAAEDMNIPFLGKVPIEPDIVKDSDMGKPFVLNRKDSETAKLFFSIVDKLEVKRD